MDNNLINETETYQDTDTSSSDVVDAQIESDTPLVANFNPSSLEVPVVSSKIPAGEVLLQHLETPQKFNTSVSPHYRTGADILYNFKPIARKFDSEIDVKEVLRDLDESSYQFTVDGASDAIKYFFSDKLESVKTSQIASDGDEVDANPNSGQTETLPQYKRIFDVTTEQDKDASSRKEKRESEFRYKMNHPYRGCFVIFSQEVFDINLPSREGTKMDAFNLEHMARQLGFEFVRTIYDATRLEIMEWILTLSGADHSQYDCFACAILTHGNDRDILYARDGEMKLSDFTRPFGADKCPTLATKPKLFFIQACRGSKVDPGAVVKTISADHVDSAGAHALGDTVDGVIENIIKIPAEADFLIANSTVPEYYAFRNQHNGSIFVQNVCAVFNSFGDSLELMQLMTRVNRLMAYEFESSTSTKEFHGKKQIPSIATRLTAELYFVQKKTFQDTGDFENNSCQSEMDVDSGTRTEPTPSENSEQQGTQIKSNREAKYVSQTSYRSNSKTFYPQVSKTDEDFKQSTTVVQESSQQVNVFATARQPLPLSGYRNRLDVPQIDITTPIRARSSSITIPHRIKSEGESSRHLDVSRIHKSPTEPVSMKRLRDEPENRFTMNRLSLPEVRRVVKQDTDHVLIVGRWKTNVRYEETDI